MIFAAESCHTALYPLPDPSGFSFLAQAVKKKALPYDVSWDQWFWIQELIKQFMAPLRFATQIHSELPSPGRPICLRRLISYPPAFCNCSQFCQFDPFSFNQNLSIRAFDQNFWEGLRCPRGDFFNFNNIPRR